jgi:hypothetical protein
LGWKLALVAQGAGRPEILESYDAERRPAAAPTRMANDSVIRVVTLRQPVGRELREKIAGFLLTIDAVQRRLARSATPLDFRYWKSPIVSEHRSPLRQAALVADRSSEAPSVRDWLDFGAAPGPGERVPNVPAEGKRLIDYKRGVGHTLLLFDGGAHTPEGYKNLSDIADRTRRRIGARVTTHIVVPREERPVEITWDGSVLLDVDGQLHRRFGAGAECMYLLRPDGYVGFRGQPATWEPLAEHLDKIFMA